MFIGLDLGTSGLRALLVDASGAPLGAADASYDVQHLHKGWSEQDPAAWINACRTVIAALQTRFPDQMKQVKGLGISGHMHGAVLYDAKGQVLRPCILWNDTRSHVEAAALDVAPDVRALSCNIVFPGFTAPKLAWVAAHEPEIFERVAKVLLPKDCLNHWFTGIYAADMSDAAGTSWLDVAARDWSQSLLHAGGMRRDQMPLLHEGTQVVGPIRGDLAAELGLPEDLKIVAGGGDNAVAACGVGAMQDGDGFVSLGTSGVVLAARDGCTPMPETAVHTFCHAVPDQWYQMGVVLAATDSLNWLAEITGSMPADLTEALGETLNGPGTLRFYPYLSGERTPHNDSAVRGGFVGLDIATTREDMTQAVLEGVCFALRDSLEALKATGANPSSLLAIGGGTGSMLWIEMLATVLNLPLELPEKGDFGAALGAARLAMVGSTGANPKDIMTKPPIAQVIQPKTELVAAFDAAYAHFHTSYSGLKALQ